MTRYLLDSNAVGDYAYRRRGVYERAISQRKAGGTIGTAIPIVAEVLGGVLYSHTWLANQQRIEAALRSLRLWPFDMTAAREYARLYADMRHAGVQMQAIDRMVAAIALTLPNCTVVSTDSDFSRVPGLKFENWVS